MGEWSCEKLIYLTAEFRSQHISKSTNHDVFLKKVFVTVGDNKSNDDKDYWMLLTTIKGVGWSVLFW